jgi:ketosteroid isomerase-like protein
MSNQNAQLIRDSYAAFAQGDIATVLELFDEDIDWHVPGRSPLSGDYTDTRACWASSRSRWSCRAAR